MATRRQTGPVVDQREQDAVAADLLMQERAAKSNDAPRTRVSPGLWHATSLEGVDVTFVAGEALPDWAARMVDRQDGRVPVDGL